MMNIDWPKAGKYIVAVSGGVDSMCLLDMLANHGEYELIVAHVNHGIREDSDQDMKLVEIKSEEYQIRFLSTHLKMKKDASEDQARQARYEFLFNMMKQEQAAAIITAHHLDDLIETSILNIRRGTDRYGVAGGMNRKGIIRPLINVRKQELHNYAKEHHVEWREDYTNTDTTYTRNRIRHQVVPTIDTEEYQKHLVEISELNKKIDSQLQVLVSISDNKILLDGTVLNQLGLRELEVLLAYAIRQLDQTLELSQPQIARLARQILLDTHKNSFSYEGPAGIIVDIQ